jgi:hypothetical protein
MTGAKGFFGRAGAFLRERPILTAGFAAGAVRSGVRSGDVEIWSHRPARGDETQGTLQARGPLLSERAAMTALGGVAFMYLWPLLIWSDVRKLEVAARGLDPDVYETKTKTTLSAVLC